MIKAQNHTNAHSIRWGEHFYLKVYLLPKSLINNLIQDFFQIISDAKRTVSALNEAGGEVLNRANRFHKVSSGKIIGKAQRMMNTYRESIYFSISEI